LGGGWARLLVPYVSGKRALEERIAALDWFLGVRYRKGAIKVKTRIKWQKEPDYPLEMG
jgi:hypothetical protein